jgi:hypothetical protein
VPTTCPKTFTFGPLPSTLKLGSLQLKWLIVEVHPGDGFQGALGSNGSAQLKHLLLNNLVLLENNSMHFADTGVDLFSDLPSALEHLSINAVTMPSQPPGERFLQVSVCALQRLPHLTHLQLGMQRPGTGPDGEAADIVQMLQPLQPQLVDVQLSDNFTDGHNVTRVVSGMHCLTRLNLGTHQL